MELYWARLQVIHAILVVAYRFREERRIYDLWMLQRVTQRSHVFRRPAVDWSEEGVQQQGSRTWRECFNFSAVGEHDQGDDKEC
jgi:hypothetical protein